MEDFVVNYCSDGRSAKYFGRMKGVGVHFDSLKCVGGMCRLCDKEFCVEAGYDNPSEKLRQFSADTVTELLEDILRETGKDLRPYVNKRRVKKK